MFLPRVLPWELAPPTLPPLSGLLTMLEAKEGLRPPFFFPAPPAIPRTAACVVLPRPPSPTPPHAHTLHHAPKDASTPASTPPLKFGVERLLAAEPRKDNLPKSPLHHHHHLQAPPTPPSSRLQPSPTTPTSPPPCSSATLPPCLASCGCEAQGGNCPSEPAYYYAPLYTAHPAHLLHYPTLYGGGVGGGGGHRGDVMGGGAGAGGHGRRKRTWTRAVFSNLQRKGLEKRFQLQKYITKPDRRQLAATLGLTDAQVKVWFQNRRMKWRHSELKKREQQTQQQQQKQPAAEEQPKEEQQTETQIEEEEEEEEVKERNGNAGSDREINESEDPVIPEI